MEDVIFAGTRDRKPTGMAEVSLTLVDPEVYDGASSHQDGPELVISDRHPADVANLSDWDESKLREQLAAETEEAIVEAQPGVILDGEAADPDIDLTAASAAANTSGTAAENVVLKIRRRKFNHAPPYAPARSR